MVGGSHTMRMTSITGFFLQSAMRRSLLGAHGQDPVVPDGRSVSNRPLRIGRYDDGLATLRDAASRTRVGTFADSKPAPVHDRTDERRAA
jgi:hypothetical protein